MDKHLLQSPFKGKLYSMTTFGIAFYLSNFSTVRLLGDVVIEPL
jgi:hypothetical protein